MQYYCGHHKFPRWLRRILSYRFNASCKIHDLDYSAPHKFTKDEADRRFLDHMLEQAGWNPFWVLMAYAYYWTAKTWGWLSWGEE